MNTVMVTRPEPDGEETSARIAALGLSPVSVPLMARHNLNTSLPAATGFKGMVITSANALRALQGRDEFESYLALPLFTVGEKTAQTARDLGAKIITVGPGSAQGLIALLKDQNISGSLFYPAAKTISTDIASALAAQGILVITSPVYEMRPIAALPSHIAQKLSDQMINAVMFYSRRTAQIFCELTAKNLPETVRERLSMICLSQNVAQPLLEAKFPRIALADYPSEEAMMAVALSFARGQIRS